MILIDRNFGTSLTITDNGLLDTSPLPGVVTWSGVLPGWGFHGTVTGTTKPVSGDASVPYMTLTGDISLESDFEPNIIEFLYLGLVFGDNNFAPLPSNHGFEAHASAPPDIAEAIGVGGWVDRQNRVIFGGDVSDGVFSPVSVSVGRGRTEDLDRSTRYGQPLDDPYGMAISVSIERDALIDSTRTPFTVSFSTFRVPESGSSLLLLGLWVTSVPLARLACSRLTGRERKEA